MSRRGNGRSVAKERFWRDVFRRHGKSGLNVREFCRAEGLKESAFYFWKRTIAERDREKRPGKTTKRRPRKASVSVAATFVPLAVVGEAARLEIVAPDGWQVRVPDGVEDEGVVEPDGRKGFGWLGDPGRRSGYAAGWYRPDERPEKEALSAAGRLTSRRIF